MNILVSGASGLVGSALVRFLEAGGQSVARLVRRRPGGLANEIPWAPEEGRLDETALEGFDAVVHLAGEPLGEGRWTARKRARIRDSRVQGTDLLSRALAGLKRPPAALLSASAVGYYGDRGEEVLTEDSPPGEGFLAEVCQAWEAATAPAIEAGIRVVNLRLGVVLSAAGGALAKMVWPFWMGLGGRLGSGRQYWSWIALDDAVEAVHFILETPSLAGPVNLCSPAPVTNEQFTRTLGRVLSRPAGLPVPASLLRLSFGPLADHMLLASARMAPARLLGEGFVYRHPELEGALRAILARPSGAAASPSP